MSNMPEVTTLVPLAPAASDAALNENAPTARRVVSVVSVTDPVPPRACEPVPHQLTVTTVSVPNADVRRTRRRQPPVTPDAADDCRLSDKSRPSRRPVN